MKNKLLKRIHSTTGILVFLLLVIVSCNSDDDITQDNIAPEAESFKTAISTAPNLEFLFEGVINDETGLKSIRIRYADWFIDKVIELEEHPKLFNLNYKFLVPQDAIPGSSHKVNIDITDLGENTVTKEVLVTLDLDITKPALIFESPLAGSSHLTGDMLPIKITVTDDFGIQSLQINSDILNIDEIITIGNDQKNYSFNQEFLIPSGIDGSAMIGAIAIDQQGNETKGEVAIVVGSSITYTNLYLVGGSAWYGWDPKKATKMWQDPNDDQWFICEFYYKSNDDVKFIGQLDWAPYNWGLDPNNNSNIINAQNSEAIGFTEGDGYYRVKFNPYALEYAYEKMTNNTAEEDDMFIMGKGFVGSNLNWNPTDAIPMIKDPSNPFVFSVEVEFSDSVDLKYIGQTDGWGPYDAGFETGGQMQIPINYVKGVVGGGTADLKFIGQPGVYKITYDYFLLRTTIQPQ